MKNKAYKVFNAIVTGIVIGITAVFAIGLYSFLKWIVFKF